MSDDGVSVELSSYRDQHFKGTRYEQEKLLKLTATLYVGNLAFYTTEEQIYELFSRCGEIRRIVMGLDKYKKVGWAKKRWNFMKMGRSKNWWQFDWIFSLCCRKISNQTSSIHFRLLAASASWNITCEKIPRLPWGTSMAHDWMTESYESIGMPALLRAVNTAEENPVVKCETNTVRTLTEVVAAMERSFTSRKWTKSCNHRRTNHV